MKVTGPVEKSKYSAEYSAESSYGPIKTLSIIDDVVRRFCSQNTSKNIFEEVKGSSFLKQNSYWERNYMTNNLMMHLAPHIHEYVWWGIKYTWNSRKKQWIFWGGF